MASRGYSGCSKFSFAVRRILDNSGSKDVLRNNQLTKRHRFLLPTVARHASRLSKPSGNVISQRCFHTSERCLGLFDYKNIDYIVYVKTGDQFQAGTDANVHISLYGENGEKAENIKLDYMFRDDFERGQLDNFQLKNLKNLKDIEKIEIWRDNSGLGSSWYVDYIEIEDTRSRKRFMFPMYRWVKAHRRYVIRHMDNCLPQFDPEYEPRKEELEYKRNEYKCGMKVPGGPAQELCECELCQSAGKGRRIGGVYWKTRVL